MKIILKFLWYMFSDCSGRPSTIRVLTFLVITNIFAVWTWVSVKTGQLVPLGADNVLLISGALGIKTIQRAVEQKGGTCEKKS